ncbi:MAG TPA: glycoside hydrolase family 27 protein [Rhizomicrobium sp.]|nr:glycoside hydrolase family 27 protein [Rhizomicrobium sp.]
MRHSIRFAALLAASMAAAAFAASAQTPALAPTPPMGWNSWDAYAFTIDEADFKANATVLAGMKNLGWNTAVIDMGWYMANPLGEKTADQGYQLDGNGRLLPDVKRYPSAANGAGLKSVGDWVHAQGLKFGIHIMRGIPREAVDKNLPIADSSFHAPEAADPGDACPWNDGNWGVRDNAAGQAWYDSEMKLFADWGVDYIKIDCISDHPYRPTEIRQVSEAIKKTGRPIVLSLSPGPTNITRASEVAKYAQLWRIGDDTWDGWTFKPNPWPNGVREGFDYLAQWYPYAGPGHWPDADMLAFGSLTPHAGWQDARESRLTHDEVRTQFTLWAIARSPLMIGANLTKLDDFTRSILTNKDVIAVNQTAWESAPVADLPKGFENARVWYALAGSRTKPIQYVAVFNLDDKPATLKASWKQLGLKGHSARELWTGKRSLSLNVTLPAHGSAIYRVK